MDQVRVWHSTSFGLPHFIMPDRWTTELFIWLLLPANLCMLVLCAYPKADLFRASVSVTVVCALCAGVWPQLIPGMGVYFALVERLRPFMPLSEALLAFVYPASAVSSLVLVPVVLIVETMIWLRMRALLEPYVRCVRIQAMGRKRLALDATSRNDFTKFKTLWRSELFEFETKLGCGVRRLQRRPLLLLATGLALLLWPATDSMYLNALNRAIKSAQERGKDTTGPGLDFLRTQTSGREFLAPALLGAYVALNALHDLWRRRSPLRRDLFLVNMDVAGHSAALSSLGPAVVVPELRRLRCLADVLAAAHGGHPAKDMEGDDGLYVVPQPMERSKSKMLHKLPALGLCVFINNAISSRTLALPTYQPQVRIVVGFERLRTIIPSGRWHSSEINLICKAKVTSGA